MSILSQKESVFGTIDSMKTLIGLPNLKLGNSFSSVNNSGSSNDFLLNVLSSLVGIEEVKKLLVEIISYSIPEFESNLKSAIKDELKQISSCGVNPSLPSWTQQGFVIPIVKIDPFNLMKVNPETLSGSLVYNDIAGGINSNDMNTYLYYTIQNTPNTTTWNQMLTIGFSQSPILPYTQNNVLNIQIPQSYQQNDIANFNNEYIDNLNLFNVQDTLVNIIDNLFGTVTANNQSKTLQEIELEEKVNHIITCVIEMDNESTISDTYFTFSNSDLYDIHDRATSRFNGVRKFITCNSVETSIPIKELSKFKNSIVTATSVTETYTIVNKTITELSQLVSDQSASGPDKASMELEFYQLLYKSILNCMISTMLSPKLQILFMMNYKFIYGQSSEYDGPIDFIKKNKILFMNASNSIINMFTNVLLNQVMKYVTSLAMKNASVLSQEASINRVVSMLSLQGVPQDVIAMIRQNIPVNL